MLAIALALGASVCWGSGDFFGGLATRRATLWAVVVGSQAAGLAGAVVVVLVSGHGWPGLGALWPVLLGGIAGSVAIATFYKALAIGTMSIIAPISATSVLIPFMTGLASGERPSLVQLAGAVLAAAGVLLAVSERARSGDRIGAAPVPGEPAIEPPAGARTPTRRDQRRAVILSLIAAVGIGLMLIGFDATAAHDPLWAMLGGRISSVIFFTVFLLILRPRIGLSRAALPMIVLIGLLDTGANGLFSLATTQGYLSIVAVLGSLYPVVTVVLAYALLRERLAPHQLAGVIGTLAGVALIAVG